uniref:RRM domain-containing protein n=1 Tax=Panagrolaimus superbus TaxID=310955 RepID=A0A914YLD2_9BILA
MSTRICVKGLPPRLYNENQLEKKFSGCGVITSIDLPALAKGKSNGIAFVGFKDKDAAEKAVKLFDKTFMGTTKIQVEYAKPLQKNVNKRPAPVEENTKNSKKAKKSHTQAATNNEGDRFEESANTDMIDKISKNGRLWLQNLAHCCTEEDLRELIGNKDVEEIRCLFNKQSGECNGNAYITFTNRDHAVEMYKVLDGTDFLGRKLKIFPCDDRKELSRSKKLQNLPFVPKSHVDHGTKSWNALFISGDVVAETFSKKVEMEKSKLLEGSKNLPAATALALAEMRIMQEIRQFLLDNNVNIYSFGTEQERSRKILIAKNLPPDFTEEDVQRTFKPFGGIKRIIFNPDIGLTAMIELNESGAKAAFDRINGAMLRGRPLKLEFAPISIFGKLPNRELMSCELIQKLMDMTKERAREGEQVALDVFSLMNATILVTFTNEVSNDFDFQKLFGKQKSKIIACGMLADQNPKCGFVFFDTIEDAQSAMEIKKSIINRDDILSIAIATEEIVLNGERSARKTLVVRNLPFTIQESEIMPLMKAVGEVKEIRLPEGVTGQKRGFGFVEFVDSGDVQKALNMFEGVHFAGRRMVIEISRMKETIKEGKAVEKKKQKITKKSLSSAMSSLRQDD